MRERAARVALREQACERHEAIRRVDGAKRLGLKAVDHVRTDTRVMPRNFREGAFCLVLGRTKARRALARVRGFLGPMARHPKERVLPVLDLPKTPRVVDVDAELTGHARPAKLSPARSRLAHRLVQPVPLEEALLGDARLEGDAYTALNAELPVGLAAHAFDEAEKRLLDVLAHLRMKVRHDARDGSRVHAEMTQQAQLSEALFDAMQRAAEVRHQRLGEAERKQGGVVHTPPYVAQLIVREAANLLSEHGLPAIGEKRLRVLDPATGPGIFLAAAMSAARAEGGVLLGVDRDPDAMQASFAMLTAVAKHRALRLEHQVEDPLAAVAPFTSHEHAQLVVGNPPWVAGKGEGSSEALRLLLADYLLDADGAPIRERRSGVLADAYVRFIRWATEVIVQTPQGGVLAFVTNHSYLDGPVHRGMRASLVKAFDEVRVLDLGGSALTARNAGERDANLFGVRPGAAVLLCAKGPMKRRVATTYARLRGDEASKRAAWEKGVAWQIVETPARSFVPGPRMEGAYEAWPSLAAWFPFHAEGVQTNRDAWITSNSRPLLIDKLHAMARGEGLPKARAHFDSERAVQALRLVIEEGELERFIVPLAYRPFEERLLFAHPLWCHRMRPELASAMQQSGLALICARQDRGERPWAHLAFATSILDNCFLSTRSSCRARAFPSHRSDGSPNLGLDIAAALCALGIDASPTDALAYVGAWLSSTRVRARFGGHFLRDYPRIPIPRNAAKFTALVHLGHRLARIFTGAEGRAARDANTPEADGRAPEVVGHHAVGVRGLHLLAEQIDEVLQDEPSLVP